MAIPIDERSLIDECVHGDRRAQKMLYERYCNEMMFVCYRYISERETAKEVLSEGFLNCYRSIGQFSYQGEGSFNAWLKRIVVNQCLMHLRKKPGPLVVDISESASDIAVDENILGRLSAKEILDLIHRLPPGYRSVFNLYFFEDKKLVEIASLLEVSENTVKSQLRKAKLLLQKQIKELYG